MPPCKYHPTWSQGVLESHGERPRTLKVTSKKLLKHQTRWWPNIQNKDIIEEHQTEPYATPALWSPGWHGYQWCLHATLHILTQAWVTVTCSRLIRDTRLCPLRWQNQGKMAAGGQWLTPPLPLLKSYSLFGNKIRCTKEFHTTFHFFELSSQNVFWKL